MPTTRRSRTIAAPADDLWKVVSDPHHLPRWWPRVTRVEDVQDNAFTEVLTSARGKVVRADYLLRRIEEGRAVVWEQLVEGTPFARVLSSAETELTLEPTDAREPGRPATTVTIEIRQTLSGGEGRPTALGARSRMFGPMVPKLGGWMVRRAATATVEEALDGLERISG
jgi:uncharacterized protein YndB with AHSA1/START domain